MKKIKFNPGIWSTSVFINLPVETYQKEEKKETTVAEIEPTTIKGLSLA